MTDQTLGTDNGAAYFTSESQLTSAAVTENMRLYAFKVCTNVAGDFQGL